MGNEQGKIEIGISAASGRVTATATGSYRDGTSGIATQRNTITPISEEIEITEWSELCAMSSDTLRNRSGVPGTFSTTLREEMTHTVNLTWSKTETITAGFQIGVDLFIKASANMSFTSTHGTSVSMSKAEVIGTTRGVSVRLEPGQAVKASLVVRRRTVTVRVPFDVQTYMATAVLNICKRYKTDAVFDIVCFTDADVEMIDL